MAYGQGGYSGDLDEIEAALDDADAAEVGGIASGRFDRDWGRSRTDQGIAGGRQFGENDLFGNPTGLLDGYDYNDDVLDTVSSTGLLDSGWDDDEAYQGQMMDAYTKDFEDDYDARNFGQKFGDWFEKNNPLIQGLNKLGFNARLDRTLGTGNDLDDEGNRIGESDRDDQVAENTCVATGGIWDGGQCIMPSTDNGDDDDDGGDIDYGAFGKPDPFASINRKRQMFYHPMMGGTAHGNVYDPYSGERPDYIDKNIWDYKPPRAGAELKNWAGGLRKWASGD